MMVIALFSVAFVSAQIKAITETGDEVVLYNDGTWSYLGDSVTEKMAIPVNETEFLKHKKATFLVKSTKLNVGIWIDPKVWSFTKGTDDDAFEFQFEKRGEDLYAMLIAERTSIPIESLKDIALQNARDAAPDTRLISEEYRNVNGIQVLMMQFCGTIKGLKISYCGYYYSNPNGSIQFLAYSGQKLFPDYIDDIEEFLNGLVEY